MKAPPAAANAKQNALALKRYLPRKLREAAEDEAEVEKGVGHDLIIYSFDRPNGQYGYTPFTIQLRLRLRHAGMQHKDRAANFFQAPKQRVPYVKLADSDELVGEAQFVIQRLVQTGKLPDLNKDLAPAEKAKDACIRAMLEDRAYFLVLYERWRGQYEQMWHDGPFSHFVWGAKHISTQLARGYVNSQLYMQGTGRYTDEEVKGFASDVVMSLNGFCETSLSKLSLDSRESREPFWILGGQRPSEADFVAFGNLATVLGTSVNPVHAALIREKPALVEYIGRIHERYFAEYKSPVHT
ncbi:glutathione s-transferase [Colletotrichum karsti]|uniref:Glutathione s-transferase n=1 Tax=Colletotrichum karsti TaxID=1095194 RepID=A0A9P6LF66_9PEZI|nr:glutathione s-transferase [Colletotrichum karsti]KAF9870240.1 glutathione s-transferase [Colletotrichum karsti]